jgi:DNA polymerase-4
VAQHRTIIHLDLDAFFCAVEENKEPALRKPFAVEAGLGEACCFLLIFCPRFGVRSAMPMGRALRLCPQPLIIPGHYRDYAQASRQVMQHLFSLTDSVEQISIDEAFLEVTDHSEPGLGRSETPAGHHRTRAFALFNWK